MNVIIVKKESCFIIIAFMNIYYLSQNIWNNRVNKSLILYNQPIVRGLRHVCHASVGERQLKRSCKTLLLLKK